MSGSPCALIRRIVTIYLFILAHYPTQNRYALLLEMPEPYGPEIERATPQCGIARKS